MFICGCCSGLCDLVRTSYLWCDLHVVHEVLETLLRCWNPVVIVRIFILLPLFLFVVVLFFCLKTNHADQTISHRGMKLDQRVVLLPAIWTTEMGTITLMVALEQKCLFWSISHEL